MKAKIRVLIVDDSSVMRKMLQSIFSMDPIFEVVGLAADAYEARQAIVDLNPDLMTLDLHLPKMDGLSFLKRVMEHRPLRTVIMSSLAAEGSQAALAALELGAVDVIPKPTKELFEDTLQMKVQIIDKLRAASQAQLVSRTQKVSQSFHGELDSKISIIAVASSTGGPEALKILLSQMPAVFPPMVIVQHMPAGFTRNYAQSLDMKFGFPVQEARSGDRLQQSHVYIAPGDFHLEVQQMGSLRSLFTHQQDPLHNVRPAADFLFKSVAKIYGPHALGVVLTGMGKDGAQGLKAMRQSGAYTISQDEKTSVVFGMPGAAIAADAVDKVLAMDQIAGHLASRFFKKAA